ncbi:MAG: hypothetical protein HKN43_08850 [Rhodothermales bacterium]|nr:hypothetical protein [Rhodothermales bacterium]
MQSVKLRLTNRITMVDEVHEYIQKWEVDNGYSDKVLLLRIALQEWISNLLLHADFGDRPIEVILDTWVDGELIKCSIEDNSVGFDLEGENSDPTIVEHDGDRGRGLWMMRQVASEGLSYEPIGKSRHKLTLSIGDNPDLWDRILSS